ncbi:MAG: hypothetical protein M3348_05515 [Acidobacteriota bacterium]|nr:hypothetical protein [Acidobacteriota bacterium]
MPCETSRRSNRRRPASFILPLTMLIACCAGHAAAQSGRRPAPEPKSAPQQQPRPADPAAPKAETKKLSLVVVKYVQSANTAFWTGMVARRMIGRLSEAHDLTVAEGKELNRKEAVDLAKSRTGDYVLWFQLELDLGGTDMANSQDSDTTSITTINPGCLLIHYIIFAPATGAQKSTGRVFQDGYRSRCAGTPEHPSPYPESRLPRLPPEYTMEKAARQAADRALRDLGLTPPAP